MTYFIFYQIGSAVACLILGAWNTSFGNDIKMISGHPSPHLPRSAAVEWSNNCQWIEIEERTQSRQHLFVSIDPNMRCCHTGQVHSAPSLPIEGNEAIRTRAHELCKCLLFKNAANRSDSVFRWLNGTNNLVPPKATPCCVSKSSSSHWSIFFGVNIHASLCLVPNDDNQDFFILDSRKVFHNCSYFYA